MKHVGLNVAADPLFTAAYVGVNAGLVVCVADDPAIHSSQNEQDSRHYAEAAKLPMLEPADSAECLAFTKRAFELSETYDTPVMLRTVTRIAHSQSLVKTSERVEPPLRPYVKDAQKYVAMPAVAVQAPRGGGKAHRGTAQVHRDLRLQPRGAARPRRSASSPPARPTSTCARPSPTPASLRSAWSTRCPSSAIRAFAARWTASSSSRSWIPSSKRPCAPPASPSPAARTAPAFWASFPSTACARPWARPFRRPRRWARTCPAARR